MSYQVVTPAELLELAQEAFDEVALTESDQIAAQEPIAALSVVSESPAQIVAIVLLASTLPPELCAFRRSVLKPLTFLLVMMMPMVLACQPAAGYDSQAKIPAAQSRVQAEAREQARREVGSIRVVVDRSDRKVRVYRGDEVISIEAVAVGMAKYPTLTGSWKFYRVDLNPEWNPPKSNWAKGRKRAPPGRAENPMGRARLVFNMPYTIHGTDDLGSLGKAASHGSVRISNDVVMDLAELLLRAGGSWDGDQWFQRMSENRGKMYQIKMQYPVPIDIVE